MSLQGKIIILGVCGGIAAYKSPDLVSQLRKLGAEVHVVMTENAKNFTTALSLETMSGNRVLSSNWINAENNPGVIEHIRLAQIADLVVVAPATANAIAKMTMGVSDEILYDVILATKAPILVAPAMNTNMWEHATVKRNLEVLVSMGYEIIDPDSGELACGTYGAGRLAETETIIKRIKRSVLHAKKPQSESQATLATNKPEGFFTKVFNFGKQEKSKQNSLEQIQVLPPGNLSGKRVIITMGATREKLDPVRYVTNHSSGKMGLALVEQALGQGMQVELITTIPVNEPWADEVNITRVESHAEMLHAVLEKFIVHPYNPSPADVLIMVAAVADYKPVTSSDHKIKKEADSDSNLILELEKTADILKEVSKIKTQDQIVVGFSVETENALENAKKKVVSKGLDLIVVNSPDAFGVDVAEVSLVFASEYADHLPQENHLGKLDKHLIAENILQAVSKIIDLKLPVS